MLPCASQKSDPCGDHHARINRTQYRRLQARHKRRFLFAHASKGEQRAGEQRKGVGPGGGSRGEACAVVRQFARSPGRRPAVPPRARPRPRPLGRTRWEPSSRSSKQIPSGQGRGAPRRVCRRNAQASSSSSDSDGSVSRSGTGSPYSSPSHRFRSMSWQRWLQNGLAVVDSASTVRPQIGQRSTFTETPARRVRGSGRGGRRDRTASRGAQLVALPLYRPAATERTTSCGLPARPAPRPGPHCPTHPRRCAAATAPGPATG